MPFQKTGGTCGPPGALVYYFTKECPIATLMGTDGIDDSYANTEEMYVLYRSILAIFAEHGRETGEAEIKAFLPGLSRKGSGDDVSIAGIVSATLSMTFIEVLKAQCEYSNAKAQREQAVREVTLAAEKKEYILAALEKAISAKGHAHSQRSGSGGDPALSLHPCD